jgi:hypothetical protein
MIQYHSLRISGPPIRARNALLDAWVADGWEAYAVIQSGTEWIAYLKRRLS